MTALEVEKILGGPAGVYTRRDVELLPASYSGGRSEVLWVGDAAIIKIEFALQKSGTVSTRKTFQPLPPEPITDRLW
jgi:hypothetical protein